MNQTTLGRIVGYLMSAVSYKYQVISLAESRLVLFFWDGLLESLATRLLEKVIWQQQLQSFSCKHILLKSINIFEFNYFNMLLLSSKSDCPFTVPLCSGKTTWNYTIRQNAVPPMLLCSTDKVPKGQQPVLPCQQESEQNGNTRNTAVPQTQTLESHLSFSCFINSSEQVLLLLTCAIGFWFFLNTVAFCFGVLLCSSLLFSSYYNTNRKDQKT